MCHLYIAGGHVWGWVGESDTENGDGECKCIGDGVGGVCVLMGCVYNVWVCMGDMERWNGDGGWSWLGVGVLVVIEVLEYIMKRNKLNIIVVSIFFIICLYYLVYIIMYSYSIYKRVLDNINTLYYLLR